MARTIDSKEAEKLSPNSHRTWREKPLFKIPAEYGNIEDFRPILEKEVAVIDDETRRAEVLNLVIKQMQSARSHEKVQQEEIEEEEQLEEVDDGTCLTNG